MSTLNLDHLVFLFLHRIVHKFVSEIGEPKSINPNKSIVHLNRTYIHLGSAGGRVPFTYLSNPSPLRLLRVHRGLLAPQERRQSGASQPAVEGHRGQQGMPQLLVPHLRCRRGNAECVLLVSVIIYVVVEGIKAGMEQSEG